MNVLNQIFKKAIFKAWLSNGHYKYFYLNDALHIHPSFACKCYIWLSAVVTDSYLFFIHPGYIRMFQSMKVTCVLFIL